MEVKGTDQPIGTEDKRSVCGTPQWGGELQYHGHWTWATTLGTLLSVLSGAGEEQERRMGSPGCAPERVPVPDLVSRVGKDAVKPEG